MKTLLVTFLVVVGLVLAPVAFAYSISSVESDSDDKTATPTPPKSDDIILSNIGDTATGGGEDVSTGIEHEDIGVTGTGDDVDDEGASDENSSNWIRVQQIPAGDSDKDGLSDDVEEEPATGSQYNESDLDFVNRLVELGGVYVKLGDIKGESKDESSDGDPDQPVITGQVPNGEIVVDGVQVRGWDPQTKEEISGVAKESSEVETTDDAVLFTVNTLNENGHFNEIRMDDSKVEINYQHGLKLFGFIPMEMSSEVVVAFEEGDPASADEFGRVKVKFPWWHIFGRKTVRPADITSAYEEAAKGNDIFLDTLTWVKRDARALQTLSNVMKNIHDPGITILE